MRLPGLCPTFRQARPYNKSLKLTQATIGLRTKSLKRACRGPTKPHTTRCTTRAPTTYPPDGLKAGGFLHLPKGTHHYEWTNDDTVIQLSGIGPVGMTYLDPADDPRKSQ